MAQTSSQVFGYLRLEEAIAVAVFLWGVRIEKSSFIHLSNTVTC